MKCEQVGLLVAPARPPAVPSKAGLSWRWTRPEARTAAMGPTSVDGVRRPSAPACSTPARCRESGPPAQNCRAPALRDRTSGRTARHDAVRSGRLFPVEAFPVEARLWVLWAVRSRSPEMWPLVDPPPVDYPRVVPLRAVHRREDRPHEGHLYEDRRCVDHLYEDRRCAQLPAEHRLHEVRRCEERRCEVRRCGDRRPAVQLTRRERLARARMTCRPPAAPPRTYPPASSLSLAERSAAKQQRACRHARRSLASRPPLEQDADRATLAWKCAPSEKYIPNYKCTELQTH